MNIIKYIKLAILCLSLIFAGCATKVEKKYTGTVTHFKTMAGMPKSQKVYARITAYTNHEDKYGSKVAMSPKMRAKEGITVAAHSDFKFGQKILIPELKGVLNKDGIFEVQDRGSALQSKKASRGKLYVFDVYLNAKSRKHSVKKIREFVSKINPNQEIILLN
jgi:hypothetical protein